MIDPVSVLLLLHLAGLGLFIVGYELLRPREVRVDFLTFFHIHFLFYYVFSYIALIFDFEAAAATDTRTAGVAIGTVQGVYAVLIGYAATLLGFRSASARNIATTITLKPRLHAEVNLAIALMFLLVAVVSFLIYSSQFGGVGATIRDAALIREELVTGGPLVMFRHFLPAGTIGALMLFVLILDRQLGSWKPLVILLFVFALPVAAIWVVVSSGRGVIIVFLATFYLYVVLRSGYIGIVRTSLLCVAAVLVILFGDGFFHALRFSSQGQEEFMRWLTSKTDTSGELDIYVLLRNMQFGVTSLEVALVKVTQDFGQLRWFLDVLQAPLTFVPARLTGLEEPDPIATQNTVNMIGLNIPMIPPGYLAFGIYSLWWPGLLVTCFVVGWVGKFVQELLIRNLKASGWVTLLFVLAGIAWARASVVGEPRVLLVTNFMPLLFFTYMLLFAHQIGFRRHLPTGAGSPPEAAGSHPLVEGKGVVAHQFKSKRPFVAASRRRTEPPA